MFYAASAFYALARACRSRRLFEMLINCCRCLFRTTLECPELRRIYETTFQTSRSWKTLYDVA